MISTSMHRPVANTFLVFLIASLFSVAWTWFAGKDLNWDLFNYHIYAPFGAINNRLSIDYFPASIQSYLNPYSFLPFFWMLEANFHSFAIGSILAIFHSLNLVLLYLICRAVFLGQNQTSTTLATITGGVSPIFLIELGTSFNDISISVLVLLGIYLAIRQAERPESFISIRTGLLSGFFLGAATGFKLTFAIYAIAGLALFVSPHPRKMVVRLATYSGGVVLGFALTNGYWAYLLLKQFGNPFFPFFNGIFESPLFVPYNISITRFIPGSIWDVLILPFEMMEPVSWVYTETVSPDLRFGTLAILIVFAFSRLLFLLFKKTVSMAQAFSADGHFFSEISLLYLFLIISTALWIMTSANGRYAIPLALLIGVPITKFAVFFLGLKKGTVFGIILVFLQLAHFAYTATFRWSSDSWTARWINLEIPRALTDEPYLFLSVGSQTNAFLAAYVHPGSAFVNIVGQASLELDKATTEIFVRSMKNHKKRLVLMDFHNTKASQKENDRAGLDRLSFLLGRFGIRINKEKCFSIVATRKPHLTLAKIGLSPDDQNYRMRACEAVLINQLEDVETRRAWAKKIFDNVEATCPSLFNPRNPSVESITTGFYRYYVGTDTSLRIVVDSGSIIWSQNHLPIERSFGNVAQWENGPRPNFPCFKRRRSSPWFSGTP